MGRRKGSLGQIADKVRDAAARDEVSVEDVITALGRGSMLPLMLVISLVAASPASGIPGLSAVSGLLIALIAAERMLNFDEVQLPAALKRRRVEGDILRKGLDRMQPAIDWLDRHTRDRLTPLFRRPAIFLPQALCLLTGLVMPFLEVIPFSASIAASGVFLLTMSLLTRDGLFFLLALIPYSAFALLIVEGVLA
jgi:hypothetical protein